MNVVLLHGRAHAVITANVEKKVFGTAGDRLADWEYPDLSRLEGPVCRLLRLNPQGAPCGEPPCGKSVIDED